MALGDLIGELLSRAVLEVILQGAAYYTGAVALKGITLGGIRLAPLSSLGATNKGKRGWNDFSFWLHDRTAGRRLKADVVCLTGLVIWVLAGAAIFFFLRSS